MTKTLKRRHDWPSRLHAAIDARRSTPFKWGENDCSLFAADIVKSITGCDVAEKWRGKYSDALGAARIIKDAGGLAGLMDGIAADFGMTPLVSVAWAQRGDVVEIGEIWTGDEGPALGICVGSQVAAAGPDGVVFVPLLKSRRAWRVG